ncbi:MAG: hybrid sensor histidine kinase/response regulator [Planctomycetes bacterium]|nr:hybrid sensor histidine kinase/response regulator [Planctomycetota bacterium]
MSDGLGMLDDTGGYQDIWLDSPLVIVRLTLSGEIAALNPAGQRFLALTQADYGCLLTQFVHPIDRNALVKMIEQVVAEESPPRMELRFRKPDGAIVFGGVSIAKLTHAVALGMVVIIRDLTQEQKHRPKLLETERMASLGVIAATVAHEVNNPLMAARSCLQILRDVLSIKEHTEMIDLAVGEIDRAARIVQDLRQLAIKGETNRESIMIDPLLDHVGRLLRLSYSQTEANISIECAPDLPPLFGDRSQLVQALINLVRNSVHAIEGLPKERCCVAMRASLVGTDAISIAVVDQGTGIAPATRRHLFEPFFSTKANSQGMGLGLSVVQAVAAAHGGRVDVTDTPGGGATFTLVLPVTTSLADLPAKLLEVAMPAVSLLGKTILVVDDEPILRRMIVRYCQRMQLTVLEASNATAAITSLAANRVDFVLLDLHFEGGGGAKVLGVIRKDHPQLLARTILMSGDLDGGASQWLGVGYAGVLQKPFELKDLLVKIKNLLPTTD